MHYMMRWFEAEHLPQELRSVSLGCAELAVTMDGELPESAEKTAGLRKLLEAKDCFVRAKILQREEAKADAALAAVQQAPPAAAAEPAPPST